MMHDTRRTTHDAQRTTHNARRTTHDAQRTTHNARRTRKKALIGLRYKRVADNCTATFIGGGTGKVLHQEHANAETMKDANFQGKSLDKYATEAGLRVMSKRLTKIREGVVDGSDTAAKLFRTIMQANPRHKGATIQKDVWHKEVNIVKQFTKLRKRKDAEELQKIEVDRLRQWWYTCCHSCGGSPAALQEK